MGLLGLIILSSLGIYISIRSSKAFLMWMGLEIKMFGFIPFLIAKNSKANESLVDKLSQLKVSLYYFIIQVIGSLLFAWSCLLGWGILGRMGLCIKIGIPPFFWWVPVLVSRLDWYSIILLRSIQKVAPLIIIRSVFDYSIDICFFIGMVGMTLRTIGIKYGSKDVKVVIGWSSVGKMSLIFFLLGKWLNLGRLYFLLYILRVIVIGFGFKSAKKGNFLIKKKKIINLKVLIFSSLLILMFSGLPPFLGFISKIYLFSGLRMKECMVCIKESFFFKNLNYMIIYPFVERYGGFGLGIFISFLLIIQIIGYIKIFIKIYISYFFGLIKNFLNKKKFKTELSFFTIFIFRFILNCL